MSVQRQIFKLKTVCGVLVFIGCILVVFCQEDGAAKSEEDDSKREAREYMPEMWHAVQTVPEGATGWIPRDPTESQGVVMVKRRRLRKRKKRPPIVSYLDQNKEPDNINSHEIKGYNLPLSNTRYGIEDPEYAVTKRRNRPNAGDPWEELQEDSVRPYIRRKVTPAYQPSEDPVITKSDANISPLSASIHFGPEPDNTESSREKVYYEKHSVIEPEDRFDTDSAEISFITTTTTKKTPKLKDILKQNGGLSLSEILQKKNITLAELLTGKQEAIKALTESSKEIISSTTQETYSENNLTQKTHINQKNPNNDISEVPKYKRLPPSVRKETINRRYEQFESLSEKEMMEAQRKRLALLQGTKAAPNIKFTSTTRYEVITEPTTEKRIFIPEVLEYNTEPYIKMETSKPETTTTTSQKPETTAKYSIYTSKPVRLGYTKGKLPITSAKLMKMTTKKSTLTTLKTTEAQNYPRIPETPMKPFKINIKDIFGFQNSENEPGEKISDEPLRMSIDLDEVIETSSLKPSTSSTELPKTPTVPKLKPYSAKDEILNLLKDPHGRAGLARILEARNMTIQELIELRERGSSQIHLADIFHNKTREPEPVEEAFEGSISSEVFTSFPVFNRRPKLLKHPEITSEKPMETSSPKIPVAAFPSFKIEIKDTAKLNPAIPWEKLYPELFNAPEESIAPIADAVDILTEEDLERLEDSDQRLYSSMSNEQLNSIDEAPQKILNISSGVKSAIIASLVIVSLSMVVFVSLLIIFRWIQRRKKIKKMFGNGDSLKPPLFEVKHRKIKTFVAETFGKKGGNYYKRHLQSMSDDWDKEFERKSVY